MKTSDGGTVNLASFFYEDGSPMIEHYGIKGMHWGIRNSETLQRYSRERSAKKARKVETKNIKAKTKRAQKSRKSQRALNTAKVKSVNKERLEANRNRALLSDAELDQRIRRLEKERRLNQLTQEELQPGRTAVKRFAGTQASQLGSTPTEIAKAKAKKAAGVKGKKNK